jgi:hypothetical protein
LPRSLPLVFSFVLLRPFETATGVGWAFEGLVQRFCDNGNDPERCAFISATQFDSVLAMLITI